MKNKIILAILVVSMAITPVHAKECVSINVNTKQCTDWEDDDKQSTSKEDAKEAGKDAAIMMGVVLFVVLAYLNSIQPKDTTDLLSVDDDVDFLLTIPNKETVKADLHFKF